MQNAFTKFKPNIHSRRPQIRLFTALDIILTDTINNLERT
jgi:hypothetical protein